MTKALYRKYRPKSLAEVVGQAQVTDILSKSLKNGKISHAYLFVGARGTGKTSVARIFAHEINDFKYEVEDDYVDIVEIDGASNRGIDDIRELREKAMIAPTKGKYKVYIIDEVHMLTKEAFNALLKILEEPPKHIVFVMATTDVHKVPVTIISRAQTFTFKLADYNTMLDYLRSVAKKEKINIDDAALDIIVSRGGGSFRDSLSLLDQISTLSNDKIDKKLVVSALGLPDETKLENLLKAYTIGDTVRVTTSLQELLTSGTAPEALAQTIIDFIIKNPQPGFLPLLSKLTEVRAPFADAKLLVALIAYIEPVHTATKEATPTVKPQVVRFDWEELLTKAKNASDVVYLQLKKSSHEVSSNTLHIYPPTKSCENILAAKNNLAVIKGLANLEIIIHKSGEKPKNAPKDHTIDRISDIMGGEVKNDGGQSPF